MNEILKVIDSNDLINIVEKIKWRQSNFKEDLTTSLGVVLLNYGSEYVSVICVEGEWLGRKKDLVISHGIPKCSNGHVCYELDSVELVLIRR